MRQITLKIPEKKLKFFMELFKQLGIEVEEGKELVEKDMDIPESHKSIVRGRMSNSNDQPDKSIDWEIAIDEFKL